MPQTLIIRTDAAKTFGQGHTLRNSNLAQAVRDIAPATRIVWASTEETFGLVPALREQFETVALPAAPQEQQIAALSDAVGGFGDEKPVMVIDGYHLDRATPDAAREKNIAGKTLFIDEKANRPLGGVDYVIDFLPNDPASYDGLVGTDTKLRIGPSYQMVAKSFEKLAAERAAYVETPLPFGRKNVLLMNGGFNIGGMLEEMISGLSLTARQWNDCNFSVFVMSKADSFEAVKAAVERARANRLSISLYADEPNIPRHMVEADLYIGAAGLTPYELGAAGGVPSVVLAAGHNQDRIAALVQKTGAGLNAGKFLELADGKLQRAATWKPASMMAVLSEARRLLNSAGACAAAREASHQFCDGKGAQRVAKIALSHA